MRIMTFMFGLFPVLAQAEGILTIQPQPDNSVRIIAQGTTGSGGQDILGIKQSASGNTTLTVTPSGISQCENGDIVLDGLRLSVSNMLDSSKIQCGLPVVAGADSQRGEIPLRINASMMTNNRSLNTWSSESLSPLQIGRVSAVQENGESQQYLLYLDPSQLRRTLDILTASFSSAGLHLGSVGENNDVSGTVQLQVSKKSKILEKEIPWKLSLESTQVLNNQYRMRAANQDRMVPYQILVAGREILPGGTWSGVVPAGSGTSQVVDIEFRIMGKNTRGLAAGISLQDTVTAVITPES